MSFLSDLWFWLLAGPFVVGVFIEMFIAWSKPIVEKRANALLFNNLFCLALLALLISTFIKVGWLAGFLALVLGLVAIGAGGRIVQAAFVGHLSKQQRKDD